MLQEKIRERMEKLDLKQADLARMTGLRTGHITDLLKGRRGKRISADTRDKLAVALEVSGDFFSTKNTHKRVILNQPLRHKRVSGKERT